MRESRPQKSCSTPGSRLGILRGYSFSVLHNLFPGKTYRGEGSGAGVGPPHQGEEEVG